jgi:hypothetical protein
MEEDDDDSKRNGHVDDPGVDTRMAHFSRLFCGTCSKYTSYRSTTCDTCTKSAALRYSSLPLRRT